MRFLRRTALTALLLGAPLVIQARTLHLDVPTGVYAVLRFGQPVEKAVLPPDAPVNGKPYFLSHNRVLLLMLQKGTTKPVQAIVVLHDGTTEVLSLLPRPGASPTIDVPGTEAPPAPPQAAALPAVPPSRNPAAGVVPVLSDLLEGQPPQGWTLHRFSDDRADYYTLRYDRVTARPVLDWTSGTGKFVKYTVSAVGKTSSTLDPSQFYQTGVRAALLSHSTVSPGHPTTLWLLWEATNGR